MNIDYLKEGLDSLMYTGRKLTPEQRVLVENSLIVLQCENRFAGIYFWGRINGVMHDYYIAFGYTKDILKDRKYFYSTDCYQWHMLPFIQKVEIFQATILCRTPFVGDTGIITVVKLDPMFDIDCRQVISALPPEEVRLKEEERLAAAVFIITEEVAIVPRGSIYKLIDGRVVPNQVFHGLNDLEIQNQCNYQLFRLPRNEMKDNLKRRSDYNFAVDFLDAIDEVLPVGHAFSFNMYRNEKLLVIKSLTWMGMLFFHKQDSHKHGFVYFGDGKKNLDLLFML